MAETEVKLTMISLEIESAYRPVSHHVSNKPHIEC